MKTENIIEHATIGADAAQILRQVEQWHKERIDLLEKAIDVHSNIRLSIPGDSDAEPSEDVQAGIRIGFNAALTMFKKLPFSLSQN